MEPGARALLARYLRQRAELGERELFLEHTAAAELLAVLASSPVAGDGGIARLQDSGTPAASASAAKAYIREMLTPPAVKTPAALAAPAAPAEPVAPSRHPAIPPSPSMGEEAAPALTVLAQEAGTCTACRLAEGRRHVVFGEGNPDADLVIVGEAPGQEEDRTGRPFVGQAGKLLDLLLMSAGFPRDSVYICNTLKCRPPQNRNPLPDELAACATFLKRQLETIRPRVLLAVGKFAGQTLAGREDSISQLRGRVFRYEGVPLVVTYHPAYLLRSPQWTRTVWEDFQLARKVLDEQA